MLCMSPSQYRDTPTCTGCELKVHGVITSSSLYDKRVFVYYYLFIFSLNVWRGTCLLILNDNAKEQQKANKVQLVVIFINWQCNQLNLLFIHRPLSVSCTFSRPMYKKRLGFFTNFSIVSYVIYLTFNYVLVLFKQ